MKNKKAEGGMVSIILGIVVGVFIFLGTFYLFSETLFKWEASKFIAALGISSAEMSQ